MQIFALLLLVVVGATLVTVDAQDTSQHRRVLRRASDGLADATTTQLRRELLVRWQEGTQPMQARTGADGRKAQEENKARDKNKADDDKKAKEEKDGNAKAQPWGLGGAANTVLSDPLASDHLQTNRKRPSVEGEGERWPESTVLDSKPAASLSSGMVGQILADPNAGSRLRVNREPSSRALKE